MALPNAKLTCEQCRQRKTRCDKLVPCGSCKKAGLECATVQRQRLPRGKSGNARNQTGALKARINRLEGLVSQLSQVNTPHGSSDITNRPHEESSSSSMSGNDTPAYGTDGLQQQRQLSEPRTPAARTPPSDSSRLIAPEFWSELLDTVSGLRDVLDKGDTNMGDATASARVPSSSAPAPQIGQDVLLFGSSQAFHTDFRVLTRPSLNERNKLAATYRERVDPVLKAVYWPTAYEILVSEPRYKGEYGLSAAEQALEFSILFVAVCTLPNEEVYDRSNMLQRYRLATEISLSQARLLSSTDIAVLQAFVIYLYGLRSCQNSAETWTLVAIAVRRARAQGIDSPAKASETVLEIEIRRRLWFSIAITDLQTAFDRGSKPLLTASDLSTLPLNVNDAELSAGSSISPNGLAPTHRFTDMSFSLMTYFSLICQHKLAEIDMSSQDPRTENRKHNSWAQKMDVMKEYEEYLESLFQLCRQSPDWFRDFTIWCAQDILGTMQLLLRRPLHGGPQAPPPEEDPYDVMNGATDVLERDLTKTAGPSSRFAWNNWVKWYALAVVLAELCHQPQGQKADRAWPVAQDCFNRYERLVADGSSGLLWRPIVRLLEKAKKIRQTSMRNLSRAQANPLLHSSFPGDVRSSHRSPESGSNFRFSQTNSDLSTTPQTMSDSPYSSSEPGREPGVNPEPKDKIEENTGPTGDNDVNWWHNWELFVNDYYDPESFGDPNDVSMSVT